MINGFGLEKIGLAALRKPIAFSILMVVITLIAAFGVTRLEFSGANIDILRDGSEEITNYDRLLNEFRDFNNDAVVLVRSKNLATVEGIETYRDIHFEYQFSERVESILSLFSLATYDEKEGGWGTAVPSEFKNDEEVRAFLEQLVKNIPNASALIGDDFNSAVMVVYAKASAVDDKRIRDTVREFEEIAKEFEDENTKISIAGQPAIRAGMIYSIVSDLSLLVPLAALFCAVLSFVIFRNFYAMALCTLPTVVSAIWFLGGMGLLGIELNFLTNILPVLLIVIIFADTLHLYLKWEKLATTGTDPFVALKDAVRMVGPACGLSSLTTAIALGSLTFSGNLGLLELGTIGAISILVCFTTVIAGLPLACYWLLKTGFTPKVASASRLSVFANPAIKMIKNRALILGVSLVLLVVGLFAHGSIESRFRLVDYLAAQSQIAESEGYIDKQYSGTTPLFAIFDVDKNYPLLDERNTKPFYRVLDIVNTTFEATSSYSLADFAKEVEKGGGIINESDIDELPRYLTSRFISEDKSQILITIFSSANTSAKQIQTMLVQLDVALKKEGLAERVVITGYPILSGVVAPRLMNNLRISLIIAVGLAIAVLMIATRSIRIGFACLVPNLLPILSVELVLWLAGIPLNMSITVALTVAFGIAVDDSIHLINQYMINREAGQDGESSVINALREVTPALISTTVILSAGLAIMLFSTLPALSVFALVVILTLIFALLCDILLLPVHLLTLKHK
ncbi:MAG: MMPL family transporter [Rhizobiaceae bacterium]|nr:MMPL family transporter [Rhizobiaceae bacterium]